MHLINCTFQDLEIMNFKKEVTVLGEYLKMITFFAKILFIQDEFRINRSSRKKNRKQMIKKETSNEGTENSVRISKFELKI